MKNIRKRKRKKPQSQREKQEIKRERKGDIILFLVFFIFTVLGLFIAYSLFSELYGSEE